MTGSSLSLPNVTAVSGLRIGDGGGLSCVDTTCFTIRSRKTLRKQVTMTGACFHPPCAYDVWLGSIDLLDCSLEKAAGAKSPLCMRLVR